MYYDGIHYDQGQAGPAEVAFLERTEILTICNRRICQIGSPSEEGKVYKISVHGQNFAMKVINPYRVDPKREVQYSLELARQSEYFLISFVRRSASLVFSEIDPEQEVETELLFMELAFGDLRQILRAGITPEMLYNYVIDIFHSIGLLAESQILHNDLHLGNVFIVRRRDHSQAVIGDFGKTRPTEWVTSSLTDVGRFLICLKDAVQGYSHLEMFQPVLQAAIRESSRLDRQYEDHSGKDAALSKDLVVRVKDAFKEEFGRRQADLD